MEIDCYLGLVHGPVNNKKGNEVTTSVTNLDIHDIARSVRTFGFKGYHIITSIQKQHQLVGRILGHWETDYGNDYNPDRQDALAGVVLSNTIEDTIKTIEAKHGMRPYVVVTGANFKSDDGDEERLAEVLRLDKRPMLLLFGTGWGLTASVTDDADFRLAPLFGAAKDGYNHLSVRSAVAIYCDRISRSLCSL